MQKRILITGVGGSGGSNFVSSLRLIENESFYIVGTDTRNYFLELASNIDKKYLLPRADEANYLEKLKELIHKEKIDFLHTQSEEEVWVVSENASSLPVKTMLPKAQTLSITYDKIRLNEVLHSNDVSVPKAMRINSKDDLLRGIKELRGNNQKVWLRAIRGGGSKASLPVYNELQAEGWIDYWKSYKHLDYPDFMVSEFLPGKEFAFQSVWRDGELITSMARERVEYLFGYLFPSGQSSSPSVARTVHREDVNALGAKAVRAVDKHATGIFCVDMKENSDGVPCVTEINAGRFYTTSINFSTAGLNMPYYYMKLAMGEKIPKIPQYNGIPAGWYWIRMIDMGYKLVKGEEWTSIKL